MPDDFISSLESRLSSESDKKAAFEQAVGEDIYAQAILDYLKDQCVEDIILAIEREYDIKKTNGFKFKSVEEIMEYLKQAADEWYLNQLSKADENNNEYSSNDPNGKVYNLRNVRKFIKKDYIYY